MKRLVRSIVALALLMPIHAAGRTTALASTPDEIGKARAATARYQNIAEAEADGYISIGFCEPGEGCHWLNPALVDGTFDADHPEILLYVPVGDRMRLVAVEYVIPLGLSAETPEGFTGADDTWRADTEGAGLWELTAWIWLHNPAGMFEQHNPRLE
jgi:hypothetical protein